MVANSAQYDPYMTPKELQAIGADQDIELPDEPGHRLEDDEDDPDGF